MSQYIVENFNNTNMDETFQYIFDIRENPEFSIQSQWSGGNSWTVKFRPNFAFPQNPSSMLRIVDRIFVMENNVSINEIINNLEDSENTATVSAFYSMLHDAHKTTMTSGSDIILPKCLKPSLRPYQLRALDWMINRERQLQFYPQEFVELKLKNGLLRHKTFYFNLATYQLLDELPSPVKAPSGGILADEMGLGKTIEILALVLCNKQNKRKREEEEAPAFTTIRKTVLSEDDVIRCICHQHKQSKMFTKTYIKCPKCNFFQHTFCVASITSNIENLKNYICSDCWKDEKPVESNATFIVSPRNIKQQWYDEVKKHISDPNFKILIYNGVSHNGWISPMELNEYDIVLTDYETMRDEIRFASSTRRQLRAKPVYRYPVSPLTMVKWWRVCLDEAQMVETTESNCSKMVKLLPTVHRWAVTGTPIEKSIESLQSLLHFLDCEPHCQGNNWKAMVTLFNQGKGKAVIDVAKTIMWRTSKANVENEINIPPYSEIVHEVTMSPHEALFYAKEHYQCRSRFLEKAETLAKQYVLCTMNPKILSSIMAPLKTLRECCSAILSDEGSKSVQSNSASKAKKYILTSDKLLAKMKENEGIIRKQELYTLIRHLKKLSYSYSQRKEDSKAFDCYTKILKLAGDNNKDDQLMVDELQQIHAIHNILTNFTNFVDHTNKMNYLEQMSRLEKEYLLDTNSHKMQKQQRQEKAEKKIQKFEDFSPNEWWKKVIPIIEVNTKTIEKEMEKQRKDQVKKKGKSKGKNKNKGEIKTFMDHVDRYRKTLFLHCKFDQKLQSIRDVEIFIQTWLDQLQTFWNKLLNDFNEMKISLENDVEALAINAFDCHINPHNPYRYAASKEMCSICKLENDINAFERLVSHRNFAQTFQEYIVKESLNHLQGGNENLVMIGTNLCKNIDVIRQEFPKFQKFAKALSVNIVAHSNIIQCKQTVKHSEQLSREKESVYEARIQAAVKNLRQINATNNYLQQNYSNNSENDPDECPICLTKPLYKYNVPSCGHHLCCDCMLQLMETSTDVFCCVICRSVQRFESVYEVVFKSRYSDVAKTYSSKIDEIVYNAIQLKKTDPNVKILIFTISAKMIHVISLALSENHVLNSCSTLPTDLEEFKRMDSGITCLLLPILTGSKGLNLIEATHVFLVEPIFDPRNELQAIGRVHRFGQTRPTFVHRFVVLNSIEERIYEKITKDTTNKWKDLQVTVGDFQDLFSLN